MSIIHPHFCPEPLIMIQGPFWNFSKFVGSNCNLSNWRTKLKVLKFHNYTGILPIIYLLFCSESRNMIQGPICNFPKFGDYTVIFQNWGTKPKFCHLQPPTQNFNRKPTVLSKFLTQIHHSNKTITQNHYFYLQSLKFNITIHYPQQSTL